MAATSGLAGCGSDSDDRVDADAGMQPSGGTGGSGGDGTDAGSAGPDTRQVTLTVGPEGGRLEHPGGAALDVPPGALTESVTLSITGAAAPGDDVLGAPAFGQAFVLGPEGQEFLLPVTVTVPFTAALRPGGTPLGNARILIAPRDSTEFKMLATQVDPDHEVLTAHITHFSVVVPVIPEGEPLNITTEALEDGVVDVYYGPFAVGAAGGVEPYGWSLAQGSQPPGMRFDVETGTLSGAPWEPGTWTFTVRLTDDAEDAIERAFSLTIHPAGSQSDAGMLDAGSADAGGDPQGAPQLLLSDYELEVVAVDDTYLYFIQSGSSLNRLPLAGGAPEAIASLFGQTQFVGSHFYYADGSTLVRQDKAGGSAEDVVTPPNPYALLGWTVAGDHAWILYADLIASVPVTGGSLTTVVDPGGNIVACDGTHIVYTHGGNIYATSATPGGTPAVIAPGSSVVGQLDSGTFYYSTGDGIYAANPATAGPGTLLAASGALYKFVVSGADIFYVEGEVVKRVPTTGGTPVVISQAGNASVIATDTDVYFASMGPDAGIYRVAR